MLDTGLVDGTVQAIQCDSAVPAVCGRACQQPVDSTRFPLATAQFSHTLILTAIL